MEAQVEIGFSPFKTMNVQMASKSWLEVCSLEFLSRLASTFSQVI